MWQSVLQQINISNFLGVAGILIGYIFYKRSKPFECVAYVVEETTVITFDNPTFGNKLQVIYDGRPVRRVTSAKVIIWNAGNSTIEPKDLLEGKPLSFVAPRGVEILSAEISVAPLSENKAKMKTPLSSMGISIDFDFMRPSEGMICEFLHTGKQGEVKLTGSHRRSEKFVQKSVAFYKDSKLFSDVPVLNKMVFPISMLLLIISFSSLAGLTLFGATKLFGLVIRKMVENEILTAEYASFPVNDVAWLLASIAFCLVSIWAIFDVWTSWQQRPNQRLAHAFEKGLNKYSR